MSRSILAIAAGFITAAIGVLVATAAAVAISGTGSSPSSSYLALNLTGSTLAGLLGGLVSARIARRRPLTHAAILSAIVIALSVPGILAPAPGQPQWYPATVGFLGAAGAVVGGFLVRWRSIRSTAAPAI
jgi:peptidoglycan/LPS O-acetylase OafA/YrhL